MRLKSSLVLHPFLFASFSILFFFTHNIGELAYSTIVIPLVIVICVTFILFLLLVVILKDWEKAGIITAIFLVLFFSYGHVYNMLRGCQIGSFVFGRYKYILLLWVLISTCGAYFTIRTQRNLHNFTNILNIMAASLVAISLINIGVYEYKTKDIWKGYESLENNETNTIDLGNETSLRDIYYIILDAYASSNTLKKIYNYDNHEFTDYLVEKGFYIASKSRSNYAYTFLSLTSSLNMEYINYLSDIVGIESEDQTVPHQMIRNSRVMRFLKSKGYKFVHFGSGWAGTDLNEYADLDVQCGKGNELLMKLIETTALSPFVRKSMSNILRERVLGTFSKLAEVHRIEGPKFVFAHIITPHPPFLFGANGEQVQEDVFTFDSWPHKEPYLNQLIFVSKKVKILVDEILSKSEVAPIIILQADHGPCSTFFDRPDCLTVAWVRPNEIQLGEKMTIFNAYYLPQGGSELLYDSITPVNSFRVIFSHYFNAGYTLLSDEVYFSPYHQPYKFINVTDKVKWE